MPERVIAIDPGERAGWAAATLDENHVTGISHGVLPCRDMALSLAADQEIHQGGCVYIDHEPPKFDVLVYETWRPRPVNGSMKWIQGNQLLSAGLMHQIRLLGWLSGAKLVGYGPDRKTVALTTMPGELKVRFDDCHEQHDQDALMHLWMYAFENWVTDPSNVTID